MLETEVQFFDRIESHVRALITLTTTFGRSRDEIFAGAVLPHLMQDTLFCRNDKFCIG